MENYVLQDHEGNDWSFKTMEEAFQKANDIMRNEMYEFGGWPDNIENEFKVVKVIGVPKMVNKCERSEMDEEELSMAKAEGWDYICDYEMQEVKPNDR